MTSDSIILQYRVRCNMKTPKLSIFILSSQDIKSFRDAKRSQVLSVQRRDHFQFEERVHYQHLLELGIILEDIVLSLNYFV